MKKFILVLLGLGLLQACGKDASTDGPSGKPEREIDPIEESVEYLDLVNDYRAKLGLRALIHSPVIEQVATDYSVRMASRGWISHLGLTSRCRRIRLELGMGNRCGEILASGQKDIHAVFKAWLNSPPHKAAIEDPNYTHTGFGFTQTSKGEIFWSQMFLQI